MSVPTCERADNGIYYAFWSENRRSKRVSLGTRDEAEAERLFGQWLLGRGGSAPAGAGPQIADLWAIYWQRHVERQEEGQPILRACWASLEPFFGRLAVSAITQDKADKYLKWRAEGHPLRQRKGGLTACKAGPSTVRRELGALVAMLRWCADPRRKILQPADVPALDLPRENPPNDRWLKPEEVKRLRAAARRHSAADGRMSRGERFIWLALETCARRQAILDLTWDRVDFETRMIHYAAPGRRQTKKRRTSVPISDALKPVLEEMYRQRRAHSDAGEPLDLCDQYVLDNDGKIEKHLAAIAELAGLDGIHPHLLRHTGATLMARRGVPLWSVCGVLGITLATATRVYAHHCPGALAEAVNNISEGC